MSSCTSVNNATLFGAPLSSKVALFNEVANKHVQTQSLNPFSNDCKSGSLPRPKISKEDYGRPARGSLSEARGFKASQQVSREILELCEMINSQGEPLFTPEEKPGDPRIVISFGELFSIYTVINDKLVGLLLRARKYKLVDFEGECLFQRRDDHVPVILIKPIREIREVLRNKLTPSPSPEPQKVFAENNSNEGSDSNSNDESNSNSNTENNSKVENNSHSNEENNSKVESNTNLKVEDNSKSSQESISNVKVEINVVDTDAESNLKVEDNVNSNEESSSNCNEESN